MTDKVITHFINGKPFQTGSIMGTQRQGLFNPAAFAKEEKVYNPKTGKTIARIIIAEDSDVTAAVAAAKKAFPSWANVPAQERANILKRFLALLGEHYEKIAHAVMREQGKSLANAKAEIARGIDIIRFAITAPDALHETYTQNQKQKVDNLIHREPLGVVVGITMSNFPAMSAMWMFPVALVCGNTFVLKPSPETPSASIVIAKLLKKAGLPDGVFNVVQGDAVATDLLLENPDVKAISFAGSTQEANYVYEKGAQYGKRVQSLGRAQNHMVIMPDANIEQACEAMMRTAYINAGERTMAISVAVLVGGVADRLIPLLKRKIIALRVNKGQLGEDEMAPLTTPEDLINIKNYIQNGVFDGAELLVDGRQYEHPEHPYGFWIGPTLFDKVTTGMELYYKEFFGPVLSCMRVKNVGEAIELINRHESSNGASCFTSDPDIARTFSSSIEVGMVGVNTPIPEPMAWHGFGGWKRGLFGDMHAYGLEGLRFFTRQKSVIQFRSSYIADGAGFFEPKS